MGSGDGDGKRQEPQGQQQQATATLATSFTADDEARLEKLFTSTLEASIQEDTNLFPALIGLSLDGNEWLIDTKTAPSPSVTKTSHPNPDSRMSISFETLLAISRKEISLMKALMTKRLQITGKRSVLNSYRHHLRTAFEVCHQYKQSSDSVQQEMTTFKVPLYPKHPFRVEDFLAITWVPDGARAACMKCDASFHVFKRKHHCRVCGEVFCSDCCSYYYADYRCCFGCHKKVTDTQYIWRQRLEQHERVASLSLDEWTFTASGLLTQTDDVSGEPTGHVIRTARSAATTLNASATTTTTTAAQTQQGSRKSTHDDGREDAATGKATAATNGKATLTGPVQIGAKEYSFLGLPPGTPLSLMEEKLAVYLARDKKKIDLSATLPSDPATLQQTASDNACDEDKMMHSVDSSAEPSSTTEGGDGKGTLPAKIKLLTAIETATWWLLGLVTILPPVLFLGILPPLATVKHYALTPSAILTDHDLASELASLPPALLRWAVLHPLHSSVAALLALLAVYFVLSPRFDLLRRAITVYATFTVVMLRFVWVTNVESKICALTDEESKQRWDIVHRDSARRVVVTVKKLRGFWVKVGQYMSSRTDLMPPAWIKELQVLQDTMPFTEFSYVKDLVESEFKASLGDLFSSFEEKPIASASIAQVHVAFLKSNNQKVVVKAQHKNIAQIMKQDMKNLGIILRWVVYFYPLYDFRLVLQEWVKVTKKEVDFLNEANNLRRVKMNLSRSGVEVIVPEPIEGMVTRKVLVMEFCEGFKVTDVEKLDACKIDRSALMERICEAYANQLYVDGFFNVDPHPGNILVQVKGGRALPVLLDFGMCRELTAAKRIAFAKMIYSGGMKDFGMMYRSFQDMGYSFKHDDIMQDMKSLQFILRDTKSSAEMREESKKFRTAARKRMMKVPVEQRTPVDAIPPELIFLVRVSVLLRGLCGRLDVSLEYSRIVLPFTVKSLMSAIPRENHAKSILPRPRTRANSFSAQQGQDMLRPNSTPGGKKSKQKVANGGLLEEGEIDSMPTTPLPSTSVRACLPFPYDSFPATSGIAPNAFSLRGNSSYLSGPASRYPSNAASTGQNSPTNGSSFSLPPRGSVSVVNGYSSNLPGTSTPRGAGRTGSTNASVASNTSVASLALQKVERPLTINNNAQIAALRVCQQLYSEGAVTGLQFSVWHEGRCIVDTCCGVMGDADPRPVQPDTLFNCFSVTKGIATTVLHMLADQHLLEYTDKIAAHWPKYSGNGKDDTTIMHLLSHATGLHNFPGIIPFQSFCNIDNVINRLEEAQPITSPGEYQQYHILSYGWLVAGLVRHATKGQGFREFLRQRVAIPLGIEDEFMVGVDIADEGITSRIATLSKGFFSNSFCEPPREEEILRFTAMLRQATSKGRIDGLTSTARADEGHESTQETSDDDGDDEEEEDDDSSNRKSETDTNVEDDYDVDNDEEDEEDDGEEFCSISDSNSEGAQASDKAEQKSLASQRNALEKKLQSSLENAASSSARSKEETSANTASHNHNRASDGSERSDDDDHDDDDTSGGGEVVDGVVDVDIEPIDDEPDPNQWPPQHLKRSKSQKYADVIAAAFEKGVREATSTSDGWQFVQNKQNVEIWRKKSANSSLTTVRGKGVIDRHPAVLFKVFTDVAHKPTWNKQFAKLDEVEVVDDFTKIIRDEYKPVFTVSARDFCFLQTVKFKPNGGFVFASTSIDHPECPPGKLVRGEGFGALLVDPLPGDPSKSEITYLTCVDPKGNIPSFVVNHVALNQPLSVDGIRKIAMKMDQYVPPLPPKKPTNPRSAVNGTVRMREIPIKIKKKRSKRTPPVDAPQTTTAAKPDPDAWPPQGMVRNQEGKYQDLIDECYRKILDSIAREDDGWKKVKTKQGVQIWRKQAKDMVVRGSGVIDRHPAMLFRYLVNPDNKAEWDKQFACMETIEKVDDFTSVVRDEYKPVFTVAGRDFCFLQSLHFDNGGFTVSSQSIDHAACPPTQGRNLVRGEGWGALRVVPCEDDPNKSLVTYMTSVDPKGNIPQFAVNHVAVNQPLAVDGIRRIVMKMPEYFPSPPRTETAVVSDQSTAALTARDDGNVASAQKKRKRKKSKQQGDAPGVSEPGHGEEASTSEATEDEVDAVDMDVQKLLFLDPCIYNAPQVQQAVIPSSNGHFSARALGKFYSNLAMSHSHSATAQSRKPMLSPELVNLISQSYGTRLSFVSDSPVTAALGFQKYKRQCHGELHETAFGHFGLGGSLAFCDPGCGLAIGLTVNRLQMDTQVAERLINAVTETMDVGFFIF